MGQMIEHPAKAGSPEWIQARLGLPTASQFSKILTPKTMKISESADKYMNQLLAEWLIGEPLDSEFTDWMERGSETEHNAVAFYEALRDVDTFECGLCLTDDRKAGATPDRLIGDDGLLELKCPSPQVHVGYIRELWTPKPTKYYAQIQGQLLITGRQWLDFMSYHPTIRPVVVRYQRDEEYLDVLNRVVGQFCAYYEEMRERMLKDGYQPALGAIAA